MSMYVFGIVVAASDETPIGRASATLQVQLPALYLFRRFRMLSTESSPRRRLGTSTRELHGASLCLIVASFSMSSALAVFEVGDEIELGWRLLLANRLVLHPCMMTLHF